MADVVEVLGRHQGCATFATLRTVVSARAVRKALAAGSIRRVAKGVYALPESPDALTVARSHGGVVSHLSAARHWGFELITEPSTTHITLPPGRQRRRAGLPCVPHWAEVSELDDVTTPIRTVIDCARTLPLNEALAIADSAVRTGGVDLDELQAAAAVLTGPHRRRIQRICALADGRSESVLESALRALLIEAGIESFEPQVEVRGDEFSARPDLGHRALRLGLEADSFAHHGTRKALVKDCRRHVNLVVHGWIVLRFSWEDVLYDPKWVVESVRRTMAGLPSLINSAARAA